MSSRETRATWYDPLALSSSTLNLHKPSRTTMYVTLPLGFSTPLERCRALAATPLYMEGVMHKGNRNTTNVRCIYYTSNIGKLWLIYCTSYFISLYNYRDPNVHRMEHCMIWLYLQTAHYMSKPLSCLKQALVVIFEGFLSWALGSRIKYRCNGKVLD